MFSVVVPLYNKTHTIIDTLESVLAQLFGDFEVVVIDDGSTDDGPAKVREHFADPRLRLIRQENAGEGAARNAGIEAARFEWIALLDADDLWQPEFLSTVDRAIRAYPEAGMFCCGGVSRNPDGSGYVRRSKRYGSTAKKVRYFEAPYFFGNASSTVFSKTLISEAGGFPEGLSHYADGVCFFRMGLKTEVVFCPELLTIYNLGVAGQVTADARASAAGIVVSSNMIYEYWNSLDPAEKNSECISAVLRALEDGLYYSIRNDDAELMDYFLHSTDPRLFERLPFSEKFLYRRRLKAAYLLRRRAARLRRRIAGEPWPEFCSDVMKVIADERRSSHSGVDL